MLNAKLIHAACITYLVLTGLQILLILLVLLGLSLGAA